MKPNCFSCESSSNKRFTRATAWRSVWSRASYGVLAYMGRLTAYDIALEAELYDPTRYYGEVKDAWFGWGPSVESEEDPRVAPVTDPGRTPWQTSTEGGAYTQYLPQIP